MHNSINDISVVSKILRGDQAAFKLLYNKYSKVYLLICLRYVKSRSDAEDMLQESWIKIYNDLKQFNPSKGKFIHWSKRIVINTCLQKLRKNSALDSFENIFEIGLNISTTNNAIDKLSLQELTKVIQSLPKGYRTVFNMYVIDGYSHKEISTILEISESTSKTQLLKAKRFLKGHITSPQFDAVNSYA
ncbi:MAG: sigma-70 family RNA polymerase sigma factor [Saprospiraceae bacterium]|nr:sigma-70 family RNA polymerase sigma factor [Saprospiraceae bacterium]